MSDQMERSENNMAARGLKRISREDLFALAPELFHTEKTHTIMMLGNSQDGYSQKVICDSTGGIFSVKCSARGDVDERVVCRHCGTELHSGRKTIQATARRIPAWEACDAWPALEEAAA